MTHIFNNIMDGGYFMAFGTLSPIQRRCKEFTESVLQEVLAIRQRERYLNNIKACITGYPPADEAEPFVCENFSQYQFFQPMDDIIDYSDRFDYLMCCLAAGVCKVQKGFEERYQQSIIKVLTFRSTACPNTPLGYILSPELLPLVRYEEDNSDEETEEEEGQQGDKEEQQLLLQNNDAAGANTPSRPTTSGSASTPAAAAQQMVVVTSTPQQPSSESALVGASPSSPSKSVRKILTEKEQLLNDVDFDTSGLTVQEIAAEQVRRKGLQSEIIDDYIANKDAYVFSVKDELRRLLAEDEKEEKEKILRELADKPSFISGGEGEFVSSKTPDEVEDVVEKQQEVITDSSAPPPPPQDDGDVTPPPAGSEERKEEEEEEAPTPSAIEVMTLPPRVEEEEEKSSEEPIISSGEPPVKMMNTLELVLLCKADHIASQSPATAVVGDEDEL